MRGCTKEVWRQARTSTSVLFDLPFANNQMSRNPKRLNVFWPCWWRGVGCCWKAPAVAAECDHTALTHPSHKEPPPADEPELWWPASQWCSSPPGGGPVFLGCPPPIAHKKKQNATLLLKSKYLKYKQSRRKEVILMWLKVPVGWVSNNKSNLINWIHSRVVLFECSSIWGRVRWTTRGNSSYSAVTGSATHWQIHSVVLLGVRFGTDVIKL